MSPTAFAVHGSAPYAIASPSLASAMARMTAGWVPAWLSLPKLFRVRAWHALLSVQQVS